MNELSGRHPLNIGQLVMGLAFAGLVTVWAVVQSDVVELSEVRWLLPLPWIVAGAVGLVASSVVSRRRRTPAGGWLGDQQTTEQTNQQTGPSDPTGATGAEPTRTEPTDTEPTEEIR